MWLPASIKMHHKFVLGWEVYLDTEATQNTLFTLSSCPMNCAWSAGIIVHRKISYKDCFVLSTVTWGMQYAE